MEVSIPLIQNQVIDHTGTYHIVQRTINGQTGLVIEEYIPEPEPEEEVLQNNNNNTRAMIIDEDENNNENNEENNNNGQMVLRGQNNVRGLPDSTGTAIEGTFEINITPITSKINIVYFNDNNNNNNYISISNMNYNTINYLDISYSRDQCIVCINKNDEWNPNHYIIRVYLNNTATSKNVSLDAGYYYYKFNNVNSYKIGFYNNNHEEIFRIGDDNNYADNYPNELFLPKNIFNL